MDKRLSCWKSVPEDSQGSLTRFGRCRSAGYSGLLLKIVKPEKIKVDNISKIPNTNAQISGVTSELNIKILFNLEIYHEKNR